MTIWRKLCFEPESVGGAGEPTATFSKEAMKALDNLADLVQPGCTLVLTVEPAKRPRAQEIEWKA